MYENFGAVFDSSAGTVTFKLFFPDSSKDPSQYGRGGLPNIKEIRVCGTFQEQLGQTNWDENTAPLMSSKSHSKGILYTLALNNLSNGYYQYKFFVTFNNGTSRWCNDPCTRYGGRLAGSDNSGFVVGGSSVSNVQAISDRLPQKDLIIYEMMIDDYTEKLPVSSSGKNKLELVLDNIDYLEKLGINAVEFMPWTASIGSNFSWGYNPFLFFSVEDRLTNRPGVTSENNVERLYSLKLLIDKLHEKGIHVIMDGVFNHAEEGGGNTSGFPYYWLYQNPSDSPFIGSFEGGGYFKDLDYTNGCVQEFIFDVCKYWIDNYQIDGIRFDYVLGFYKDEGIDPGISRLIDNLHGYLFGTGRDNFSMMLEHLPDNRYEAIDDTNKIDATGCWFDPLMYKAFDFGKAQQIQPSIMRDLNTNKDFAPGKGPVTYIENHDHSTLVNVVGGNYPGVDRDHNWFKTQPYAIALFTVPGAVLIHNGQEFGDEYFIPGSGSERVRPRPLNWHRVDDSPGKALMRLYKKLIKIRKDYPGLKSPFFYPSNYDQRQTRFNLKGYGVDTARNIIIYHRWGTGKDGSLERFVVVINCSSTKHYVDVPFPSNGTWTDILNDQPFTVSDYWRKWQDVDSNWGRIFYAN